MMAICGSQLLERAVCRLIGVNGSVDVHAEQEIDVLVGEVSRSRAALDAGDVGQDVQTAQNPQGLGEELVDFFSIADVAANVGGTAACRRLGVRLFLGGLAALVAGAAEHDLGTLSNVGSHAARADALRATGYDDLVFFESHFITRPLIVVQAGLRCFGSMPRRCLPYWFVLRLKSIHITPLGRGLEGGGRYPDRMQAPLRTHLVP